MIKSVSTLKDTFHATCYGGLDMYLVGASVWIHGFVLVPCNLKCFMCLLYSSPSLLLWPPWSKQKIPKQIEHKPKGQQKNLQGKQKTLAHNKKIEHPPPLKPNIEQQKSKKPWNTYPSKTI